MHLGGLRRATSRWRGRYVKPIGRYTLYPLLSFLIAGLLFLVAYSLRVRFLTERFDRELVRTGRRLVYVFWHGRQFLMFRLARGIPCAVLVSLSDGGDIQAGILRLFGHIPVRGSSTRGAVEGLVKMIRAVRRGKNAAFAVDGPKGPIHVVKPGALEVARKTGAVVLPVGLSYGMAIVFKKAWDRYHLPLPFTRACVALGEPVTIPKEAPKEALEAWCDQIAHELSRLTRLTENARRKGVSARRGQACS